MTTLSAAQVAALVKQAGFPSADHVTMVAVAKAESGFRVEATNPRSSACGLFQILRSAHPQYDMRKLTSDAAYNTKAAYEIYRKQGKKAWVAYTSGSYKKFLAEARQGVAQASGVTGNPALPGPSSNETVTGQKPGITYGALAPQAVAAGVGIPLVAAKATESPLSPLRIYGSAMWADYSTLIIGTPMFEAGIETIPNVKFTIADPEGNLMFKHSNVFTRGARIQYVDLNLRLDTLTFEPGSHGTGQLTITAIDDIVYALMRLQGPATAGGISATQWLSAELQRAGIDPNKYLLGESVVTQSEISRDVPDQQGAVGAAQTPSGWTTQVRLARELGKRLFISGSRIVFGSSAFAMRWCAPGALRLTRHAAFADGEKWLGLPTARYTSIGNRSDVLEVTGKVPLNRALFFRPGVPVAVQNTPSVAGDTPITLMCSRVSYGLGTDTDGADITLLAPVDPPPQPPQAAASANFGAAGSGVFASGGGADGQVDKFVALALQQTGDRYVFGAEASMSDPDPRAFDCSELVEWAASRAGISPKVPDGSGAQRAHCQKHGTIISVDAGIRTKGALLFRPGHVAISLGNGKTIEASTASKPLGQGNANGRGWAAAGRIPGAKGYR